MLWEDVSVQPLQVRIGVWLPWNREEVMPVRSSWRRCFAFATTSNGCVVGVFRRSTRETCSNVRPSVRWSVTNRCREEHVSPVVEEDVCACSLALMKSLPESYADIIRRVDIEGAGLAEVAGILRIATGNAAVRLHRARRALRARLREHCGVESMRQCLSCICNERGCCSTALGLAL